MSTIIITEENKLRSIVQEEDSKLLPTNQLTKTEIDTMTLGSAFAFLAEYGYPMPKAKLYKLTAYEHIPCRKFGQKLVFSRKDLLQWAKS